MTIGRRDEDAGLVEVKTPLPKDLPVLATRFDNLKEGAPALVQVMHNKVGEKTYANITSIMRLPKGQKAPAIPGEYVRFKDREEQEPEPQTAKHDDDSDLPF